MQWAPNASMCGEEGKKGKLSQEKIETCRHSLEFEHEKICFDENRHVYAFNALKWNETFFENKLKRILKTFFYSKLKRLSLILVHQPLMMSSFVCCSWAHKNWSHSISAYIGLKNDLHKRYWLSLSLLYSFLIVIPHHLKAAPLFQLKLTHDKDSQCSL